MSMKHNTGRNGLNKVHDTIVCTVQLHVQTLHIVKMANGSTSQEELHKSVRKIPASQKSIALLNRQVFYPFIVQHKIAYSIIP